MTTISWAPKLLTQVVRRGVALDAEQEQNDEYREARREPTSILEK
jgi:hypothetical protein